jgi:hypothetical protein
VDSVWLVLYYDPCEPGLYTVEGVFSTRELAEADVASREKGLERYEVEEFAMDRPVEHPAPKPPTHPVRPIDPLLSRFASDLMKEAGRG